jgi:hypothetical protein
MANEYQNLTYLYGALADAEEKYRDSVIDYFKKLLQKFNGHLEHPVTATGNKIRCSNDSDSYVTDILIEDDSVIFYTESIDYQIGYTYSDLTNEYIQFVTESVAHYVDD